MFRANSIARAALLFLLVMSPAEAQSSGELSAPTGLDASDGAYSTKVGLAWEHVRDVDNYRVLRAEVNDPAFAVVVGATPSIIFFDETAVPGETYFYWIQSEADGQAGPLGASDEGFRAEGRTSLFGPIDPLQPPSAPAENPITGAKVYLGKTLFWEEQISATRTVSCGTCHRPRSGGSDPRSMIGSAFSQNPGKDAVFDSDDDIFGSPGVPRGDSRGTYLGAPGFGIADQVTPRKAQSFIDAGHNTFNDSGLLWDGRALPRFIDPLTGEVVIERGGALETQALMPILDDTEMSHEGADWGDITARLAASKPLGLAAFVPPALSAWLSGRGYPELFAEAFGTLDITPARIAMAIASYERTLFSDRAPIDLVVSEITEEPAAEGRGREVFLDSKCDACHRAGLFSDNRFHAIGVRPTNEDEGRLEVTGDPRDVAQFRTPSLRNVGLRAPFMHNGGFATLEQVVDFYDRGGDFDSFNKDTSFVRVLGLSDQEKSDLVAFLRNMLTDPRVEAEAGPLFDRPLLYSESARVPAVFGEGSAAAGRVVPQVRAIEPPFAGNPNFTVGLFDAAEGATAFLVIDEQDPGIRSTIPAAASFFRGSTRVSDDAERRGSASLSLRVPDDAGGMTLFGRWYVSDFGSMSASPGFRMTIFEPGRQPPADSMFAVVSAASLSVGSVAPESIVSGFGVELSSATGEAEFLPLPTSLAGVNVLVTDGAGRERMAGLFFSSPRQINYQVPPGTAEGEAVVSVVSAGRVVAGGNLQVTAVAPGLFAANANGRGTAAAQLLRVARDGSQSFHSTARFDTVRNEFVSAPIDFGPEDDRLFLVLFGTGIRFHDGNVTATVGGEAVDVLFAGRQPQFVGVDQVNLRLPRTLAGRGEVDIVLVVDGQAANTVQVAFE